MSIGVYEIPRRLAAILGTVGPVHEDVGGDYCHSLRVIVTAENEVAGFLIEQRLAEPKTPAAEGQGFSFKVPVRAAASSEPTFVYAETLALALEYVRRGGGVEAESQA